MGFESWIERTMIIERLCGVALYAIVLFWFYFLIKKANGYKTVKKYLNYYIVVLCLMAFFFIPPQTCDLFRWFDMSENWHFYSFYEFCNVKAFTSTSPIAYIFVYLCRLTGVDGILPASCAFVFFGNVFFVLKDLVKKHDALPKNIATSLLVIMSTGILMDAMGGVRCFPSLSILARCFYEEIYNDKAMIKTLPWEIVACLIHPMSIIVLAIRFFFLVFQKNNNIFIKFFNVLIAIIFCFFAIKYAPIYIGAALDKADSYISSSNGYTYKWGYVISIIIILQIFIVLLHYKKIKSCYIWNMCAFNSVLFLIEVLFSFEYSIFHRTTLFSAIMLSPLISKIDVLPGKGDTLRVKLEILSIVMLLVACVRGDLSAYKFFLL